MQDGKNVFSVLGQTTQKHVFLSVFGSATPPPSPRVFFNVFGIGPKHVFFTVLLRLCLCTVFAIYRGPNAANGTADCTVGANSTGYCK